MRIYLRHKLSETSEEIYAFDVDNNGIQYKGIEYSNRNGPKDIWGYDWKDSFKIKTDLINKLKEKAGFDRYEYDSELLETEYAEEYRKILKTYNPVSNKTKHDKTYLTGHYFGGSIPKEYMPKMSIGEIKAKIIEKVVSIILEKKVIGVDYE